MVTAAVFGRLLGRLCHACTLIFVLDLTFVVRTTVVAISIDIGEGGQVHRLDSHSDDLKLWLSSLEKAGSRSWSSIRRVARWRTRQAVTSTSSRWSLFGREHCTCDHSRDVYKVSFKGGQYLEFMGLFDNVASALNSSAAFAMAP